MELCKGNPKVVPRHHACLLLYGFVVLVICSVGGSAKKIGLRIKELERLYGIKQGGSGFYGNRYSGNLELPKKSEALTQEDLAAKLGISVDTMQNYKTLADMIAELDEMV